MSQYASVLLLIAGAVLCSQTYAQDAPTTAAPGIVDKIKEMAANTVSSVNDRIKAVTDGVVKTVVDTQTAVGNTVSETKEAVSNSIAKATAGMKNSISKVTETVKTTVGMIIPGMGGTSRAS